MRIPLRRLLRLILKYSAKAALKKHAPEVIAILGAGETAIAREAIYTALKTELPVRRNLESPEAEFSVPLAIFGAKSYPKENTAWVTLLIRTFFQLLFIRPYHHYLILELNAVRPEILRYWLEITKPETAVICGNFTDTDLLPKSPGRIFRVASQTPAANQLSPADPYQPYLNMARTVGLFYKIPPDKLEAALTDFELPRGRIRLLTNKYQQTIVDATYYYSPPPLSAVIEVAANLPGGKLLIISPRHRAKAVNQSAEFAVTEPYTVIPLKDYSVIILYGPRKEFYPLRKKLLEF